MYICFKQISCETYCITAYDPNPLLLIGKRRRHTTSDISEHRKSENPSVSDSHIKVKRGPGRPPKIKQDDFLEIASEDEQDIDVCGFDDSDSDTDKDDTDSVFSLHSSQQHNKHHGSKRKHKSDNDKEEKVKKKKVRSEDKKKERNVFEDQGNFLKCNHSDIPHLSFIHHYHFGNHHEGKSILAQSLMFTQFKSIGNGDIARTESLFQKPSFNVETKSRAAAGTNYIIHVVLPSSCFYIQWLCFYLIFPFDVVATEIDFVVIF